MPNSPNSCFLKTTYGAHSILNLMNWRARGTLGAREEGGRGSWVLPEAPGFCLPSVYSLLPSGLVFAFGLLEPLSSVLTTETICSTKQKVPLCSSSLQLWQQGAGIKIKATFLKMLIPHNYLQVAKTHPIRSATVNHVFDDNWKVWIIW